MSTQPVNLEQMAARVESAGPRPRIVVAGNFATPWPAITALDRVLPEWTLHMLNPQLGAVPTRSGVTLETCFVGPGMRDQPTLSYVPSRLSMVPVLLKSTLLPDIVVLHTTPPRAGSVSLGTEVNILPAAVEAARGRGGLVVAVVNSHMPWTYGDAVLSREQIDLLVELDHPLQYPPPSLVDDAAHQIGAQVASRVPDGATLP